MKADVCISLVILTKSHLKVVGKRPAFHSLCAVERNTRGKDQQAFTWHIGSTELVGSNLPAKMSTITASTQKLHA
jgi:hypothetical protein